MLEVIKEVIDPDFTLKVRNRTPDARKLAPVMDHGDFAAVWAYTFEQSHRGSEEDGLDDAMGTLHKMLFPWCPNGVCRG